MTERRTLVTGLSPWSSYLFRIRAESEYGIGDPSWSSEQYTTAEMVPEDAPANVGGGGGKVGDLVITWDPLEPAQQNGRNLYYIVHYKKRYIIDEEYTEVGRFTGSFTLSVNVKHRDVHCIVSRGLPH